MLMSKCSYKILRKILIVSLFISTQTVFSSIVEHQCGDSLVQIKIKKEDVMYSSYAFYYKNNLSKSKLFYKPKADRISVACIKDKNNHDLLLIEESCSGSACSDDGTYAVFNPGSKRMLIKFAPLSFDVDRNKVELATYIRNAEDKNHKQVAKLIGYNPPYLPDEKGTFCCNRDQY